MKNNYDVLSDISCRTFINFLRKNGYEIKKSNPRHVPGQGYSPPPYYGNINIDTAITDFIKQKEKNNISKVCEMPGCGTNIKSGIYCERHE